MNKVLITDNVHPILLESLKNNGCEVLYQPGIPYDDVGKVLPELSGIVINTRTPMRRAYIDLGVGLKFIARLGSGLDIIDVRYAEEKNIAVLSAPQGNANAVAEHAIGMLYALANNIVVAHNAVVNFGWPREYCRGIELEEKTIGVIGVGNNGTRFIEKLQSLCNDVVFYDKYRHSFPESLKFARSVSIEELLEKSDVISLHIPLSEETYGMVDGSWLQRCKRGVILINTSRGKIIKTNDLLENLESGQVGGACLDVLENEKPWTWGEENTLLMRCLAQRKNVVLSPHIAGWTQESYIKISKIIADNINKELK